MCVCVHFRTACCFVIVFCRYFVEATNLVNVVFRYTRTIMGFRCPAIILPIFGRKTLHWKKCSPQNFASFCRFRFPANFLIISETEVHFLNLLTIRDAIIFENTKNFGNCSTLLQSPHFALTRPFQLEKLRLPAHWRSEIFVWHYCHSRNTKFSGNCDTDQNTAQRPPTRPNWPRHWSSVTGLQDHWVDA